MSALLEKRFTIAFQLSAVSRFSRDHMQKPENVLEHIGFCTFYACLLAKSLQAKGYEINYNKLMNSVMAHDLDESILGDVPRSTKYYTPAIREAINNAEGNAIKRLEEWLDVKLFYDWKFAKEGVEGQILKVTDIAAVVYKNWIEIEFLGNRSFLRVCIETASHLNKMNREDFVVSLAQELDALRELNLSILKKHQKTEADALFAFVKGEGK